MPLRKELNSSKNFTFSGEGSIVAGAFVKEGTGTVTMKNENTYTEGNVINGGTVSVSKLANSIDPTGNLGGLYATSNPILITNDAALKATAAVTNGSAIKVTGSLGSARGVIENSAKFTQQATISGDTIMIEQMPIFGGYCGGLEETAICDVATTLASFGLFSGNFHLDGPIHIRWGVTTAKETLQIAGHAAAAIDANTDLLLANQYYPVAGPCTVMGLVETAAQFATKETLFRLGMKCADVELSELIARVVQHQRGEVFANRLIDLYYDRADSRTDRERHIHTLLKVLLANKQTGSDLWETVSNRVSMDHFLEMGKKHRGSKGLVTITRFFKVKPEPGCPCKGKQEDNDGIE